MKGDKAHAAQWVADGEDLYDVLPSCGCGCPREVFAVALRVLEAAEMSSDRPPGSPSLCEVARPGGGDDDPLTWAFLATLDNAGLIEHGSTIRWSWLLPLGKAVLARLRRGLEDEVAPPDSEGE